MPARLCRVSFTDPSAVAHSVEVHAETLFEAIALALRDLRSAGLTAIMPGPATQISVHIKSACEAEHTVTFRQFENWLGGTSRSPKERLVKDRLRELASGGTTQD
jgi:hypothetical protein